MQRICGPGFCFKDHHYKSFCLSRDSLSCATRSADLCILLKFIFLHLWYTFRTILALFTHFVYTNFFMVYYHAEYFLIPDDAIDR